MDQKLDNIKINYIASPNSKQKKKKSVNGSIQTNAGIQKTI